MEHNTASFYWIIRTICVLHTIWQLYCKNCIFEQYTCMHVSMILTIVYFDYQTIKPIRHFDKCTAKTRYENLAQSLMLHRSGWKGSFANAIFLSNLKKITWCIVILAINYDGTHMDDDGEYMDVRNRIYLKLCIIVDLNNLLKIPIRIITLTIQNVITLLLYIENMLERFSVVTIWI